jgi:hypothetical protein
VSTTLSSCSNVLAVLTLAAKRSAGKPRRLQRHAGRADGGKSDIRELRVLGDWAYHPQHPIGQSPSNLLKGLGRWQAYWREVVRAAAFHSSVGSDRTNSLSSDGLKMPVFFVPALALCFLLTLSCAGYASPCPTGLENVDEKEAQNGYEETEILNRAISEADKNISIGLATDIVDRDLSVYGNPIFSDYIRARAFSVRALAKEVLGRPPAEVLSDRLQAAELGSFSATQAVLFALLKAKEDSSDDSGVAVHTDLLERLAWLATLQGDACAAKTLADIKLSKAELESNINLSELIFIQVSAVANSGGSPGDRLFSFFELVKGYGAKRVEEALELYSPVGSVVRSSDPRLPPRGYITTMTLMAMEQHSLRRQYIPFKVEGKDETESAVDFLNRMNSLASREDISMRLYLLSPHVVEGQNDFALRMDLSTLLPTISAGDIVVVRCGPLAHMATVMAIDREGSRIYFYDPFFEFWQPSHNDCVSQLSLVKALPGRYLAGILFSELASMLEVVYTDRDFHSLAFGMFERLLEQQKGELKSN